MSGKEFKLKPKRVKIRPAQEALGVEGEYRLGRWGGRSCVGRGAMTKYR
jgi:hypothetical protein